MAPYTESSHTFQKLKLDTKPPQKLVSSAFASIPRRSSQRDEIVSSFLPTPELAESHSPICNGGNTWHGVEGEARGQRQSPSQSCGSAAASSFEDIETTFRKRQTSISFDKQVTLDSGNRHSIEEPLPKPGIPQTLLELPDGEEHSDNDSYFEEPLQPRGRHLHRVGESRYPLLQSTVDELATDREYADQDHVASLTSEATASPLLEEIRTPLDPSADFLLSPLPTSSPIEFPIPISRRNGSQRSKSHRSEMSEGSLRKTSRRSSARTGRSMSSNSPATAWLSRWDSTKSGEPLKKAEPDDEGQEIGDHSEYIIGKQIGFGGFSVVKEASTIEGGQKIVRAVKIVRKKVTDKQELENEQIQSQFEHEVNVWRYLRHPYILPLLQVYDTEFATYCITKLNVGGTLFDLVRATRKKKEKGLPLHIAKRYIYQLASAIRYLHKDITLVHRDIKLENCLLDMSGSNATTEGGDVLLCDFGMADYIVSDQRDTVEPHSAGPNQNIGPSDTSTSVAGSLQYAAPELFGAISPVYSPAADIWAFGVVVYALLTAALPFDEGMNSKTMNKILKSEWDVQRLREAQALSCGSDDAVALVRGCFELNPAQRWSITEVLNCRWLEGCEKLYEHVERPWVANQ
ncbi:serine/threonine-protein kinase-like protein DCLK1 [Lepidopterella palustris CBS 459.81]|uniref:Serine/threonine-protein kinase-like protein DCLK1 n=1 Tax=Lepidopterella palustris CBS 459.81 TaxID=1314670 RepID=A0A8E2E991_9PEZI|nr:serine/threonine-protein kinase-like protein DCLK1 [Lepidopterella palustris CBS 459.81]